MSEERSATKPDVEDSASTTKAPAKGKPSGNKGKPPTGKGSSTPKPSVAQKTSKPAPTGSKDGTSILESYGLSISGRKERILSPFKADKFFHFVEDSWKQLVTLKPSIHERFSLEEFRHASALQLYSRLESVKFDAIGTKPGANVRIPLPRNLRVFHPLWSVLANIGIVDDDELRVTYIPDGILPMSKDLDSIDDVKNLMSCTLYDWSTSWQDVLAARNARQAYQSRNGYTASTDSNETPADLDQHTLIEQITSTRGKLAYAVRNEQNSDTHRIIDGKLFRLPLKSHKRTLSDGKEIEEEIPDKDVKNEDLVKLDHYLTSSSARRKLEDLMALAKGHKKRMIQPRFDVSYKASSYTVSDGTIAASPGAYGAWLRWDPQLWLEYEQFVEEVTPMAIFSLSMPAETTGTYAWLLPVEKRDDDDVNVSARLPRASIPPRVWILALLLQSSTLSLLQRSTFYVETDRLSNVQGLRLRYIRASIKDPSAVEQYGTY